MSEETLHTQMYPFKEVEAKWRAKWDARGDDNVDLSKTDKEKRYIMCMFIYPSGDKLHIGHWWNYAPTDSYARLQRMKGYRVFEPMGFDAFGLPAENFAIKHNVHPADSTKANVEFIREQLRRMGNMYDWRYEVNTSTPEYYKWTQWVFLQLYRQGLVEYKTSPVNWCPKDQTVLANEQVVGGNCERCGTPVERRKLAQWFFKITKYAESLLEELDRPVDQGGMDWPERTKSAQKYWIGRSEGASIKFPLIGIDEELEVFTTRPDTLYGVSYVVLAPEHNLVDTITTPENRKAVSEYVAKTLRSTEIDRMATDREKTGVFTGTYCTHPLTGAKIPVWIADYVLEGYGTGVVMAVPAHDERDFEFARKFKLPVTVVIQPKGTKLDSNSMNEAYTEAGIMVHSEEFNGMASEEAGKKIVEKLAEKKLGATKVTYRLRDWSVSRQRYWGAPIPMIHCPDCGVVPVPDNQLPVLLPSEVKEYRPKGKSPLEAIDSFIHTTCPNCGKPAKRDPDTMDTFVCSSWYMLRFPCAKDDKEAFDSKIVNRMMPVDVYVGGTEHTYGHLLYSRFICHAFHDAGLINFKEPFKKMVHQGVITHGGARMSKSRGNVVNPEPFIERYGSDVFRMYLMFMGDYAIGGDWSDGGIAGIERAVNRIWRLVLRAEQSHSGNTPMPEKILRALHKLSYAVDRGVGQFKFNTAIAALMTCVNEFYSWDVQPNEGKALHDAVKHLVLASAPLAPHFFCEAWERLGNKGNLFDEKFPEADPKWLVEDTVEYVLQVNGKVRGHVTMARGLTQEAVLTELHADEAYKKNTYGFTVVKEVVIPDKLVNVVIR